MDNISLSITVYGKYSLLYVVGFWTLFSMFSWLKHKIGKFIGQFMLYLFFAVLSFITFYSLIWAGGKLQNLIVYSVLVPFLFYRLIVFFPFLRPKWVSRSKDQLTPLKGQKDIKYQKTGLSSAYSKELKERLEKLMEVEGLFMDPELRLDRLAHLLNVSRHHASQVINENFDMNFNDYINGLRIQEAKKRLKLDFANSSETMSDLAYSCGFNNRASFYRAFKKDTHLTPKEFMQSAGS